MTTSRAAAREIMSCTITELLGILRRHFILVKEQRPIEASIDLQSPSRKGCPKAFKLDQPDAFLGTEASRDCMRILTQGPAPFHEAANPSATWIFIGAPIQAEDHRDSEQGHSNEHAAFSSGGGALAPAAGPPMPERVES